MYGWIYPFVEVVWKLKLVNEGARLSVYMYISKLQYTMDCFFEYSFNLISKVIPIMQQLIKWTRLHCDCAVKCIKIVPTEKKSLISPFSFLMYEKSPLHFSEFCKSIF